MTKKIKNKKNKNSGCCYAGRERLYLRNELLLLLDVVVVFKGRARTTTTATPWPRGSQTFASHVFQLSSSSGGSRGGKSARPELGQPMGSVRARERGKKICAGRFSSFFFGPRLLVFCIIARALSAQRYILPHSFFFLKGA